jgi:integrase
VPLVDHVAQALDGLSRRDFFTARRETSCSRTTCARYFDDAASASASTRPSTTPGSATSREGRPPRFHDLRHAFGTLAVRAFPLSDVKAFMGHQSMETTMIYVQHVPLTERSCPPCALLAAEAAPPASGRCARSVGWPSTLSCDGQAG